MSHRLMKQKTVATWDVCQKCQLKDRCCGDLWASRFTNTQNDRWTNMLLQPGTVQRQRPDDPSVRHQLVVVKRGDQVLVLIMPSAPQSSAGRLAAHAVASIQICWPCGDSYLWIRLYWARFNAHQTHYRSYRGRVFTSQMTQPTMSKHWRKIGSKNQASIPSRKPHRAHNNTTTMQYKPKTHKTHTDKRK